MTSKQHKMRFTSLLFVLAAFCLSFAESTRSLHKLQCPEGHIEHAHGGASLPTKAQASLQLYSKASWTEGDGLCCRSAT